MYLKDGIWVPGIPEGHRISGPGEKFRLPKKKKPLVLSRCLIGQTNILMNNGALKQIRNIELGEYVITKSGYPSKVISKTYSGKPNKLIKFRSSRMLNPITCTPEHKVLVLDLRDKSKSPSALSEEDVSKLIKWIPAEELTSETLLMRPTRLNLNLCKPERIDLAEYLPRTKKSKVTDKYILSVGGIKHKTTFKEIAYKTNTTYWQVAEVSRGRIKFTKEDHYKIKKELDKVNFYTKTNRFIDINYDFGKLIGIILGDGTHRIRKRNDIISSGEISIYINSTHRKKIREVQRVVKQVFNIDTHLYKDKRRKCVRITFYSIPIAKLIKNIGSLQDKNLPPNLMFNSPDYLVGVLDGLLMTDGYTTKKNAFVFSTTSPSLANLCYFLFEYIGLNTKVSFQNPRMAKLKDGRIIKGTSPEFKVWHLNSKNASKHQRIEFNGLSFDLSQITEKDIIENSDEDVWDIGIENDHSFIAENVIVHNSHGGMGDAMLMASLAKAIKRKNPGKWIVFSVDTIYANGDLRDLFFYNPFIDQIIDYRDTDRSKFRDFLGLTDETIKREIFSCSSEDNIPFPIMIDVFAEQAKVTLREDEKIPLYYMTSEEEEWGKEQFERIAARDFDNNNPTIALSTSSTDVKRVWPDKNITEFVADAATKNFNVMHFTWHEEKPWIRPNYSQIYNWRLRGMASLLKQCDYLVSTDSGIMHLGEALGIKTIGLFGNIPPNARIQYYKHTRSIWHDELACIGCAYLGCPNDIECMKRIKSEEIFRTMRDF